MPNDAPNGTPGGVPFRIPAPAGQISPPPPDAEEKLRKILEEQGVAGKARIENLLGAGKDLFDSEEEYERFIELLEKIRKTP